MTSVVRMKNNNIKKRYWVLFLVPFFVSVSCKNRIKPAEDALLNSMSGRVFGTSYSILYIGEIEPDSVRKEVSSALRLLNMTFSTYTDTSIISVFNHKLPLPVLRSVMNTEDFGRGMNMFNDCFQISEEVHGYTYGAFDPTGGPLFNLWGFAENKKTFVPDSNTVDSVLKHVGMQDITYNNSDKSQIFPPSDSTYSINFNAIAKGYAVDVIAGIFQRLKVPYMVEIGGEMRMGGVKNNGDPWTIGINRPDPDSEATDALIKLQVTDISIATSGNYRNYYVENGVTYSHTIDPRTGYPVKNDLLSASVFNKDCAVADAYATAFMVMGSKEAIKTAEENDLDYILVLNSKRPDGTYEIIYSENAEDWLVED